MDKKVAIAAKTLPKLLTRNLTIFLVFRPFSCGEAAGEKSCAVSSSNTGPILGCVDFREPGTAERIDETGRVVLEVKGLVVTLSIL